MSFVGDITRRSGIAFGAIGQIVNTITNRVTLPIPGLPRAPIGDLLEPRGADQRKGADLIERAFERFTGDTHRTNEHAMRLQRPLIAQTTLHSKNATDMTRLDIEIMSAGLDWQKAGSESSRLAVYVNGSYYSTMIVLAERGSQYSVDLGMLGAGDFQVEFRLANDAQSKYASAPTIRAISSRTLGGDEALVARHAPILELRDVDKSARQSTAYSDAPLVVVPALTKNSDGTTTIRYRVGFSNEEGGTLTPKLFSKYGRSLDLEPAYEVRVAADGRIISAKYQSAVHQWRSFDGERIGDRPLLRVATANSMFSTRVRPSGDGAERWSPAPLTAVTAATSDFEVMRANPWLWAVMSKELLREGKVASNDAARGAAQVADPRRYVYTGSVTDAVRAAIMASGGLELVLSDGRRVFAKAGRDFARGDFAQGALELPRGAVSDAVIGVGMLGVEAIVLNEQFEMRELAYAA